ncbi:hypothetical protein AB0I81_55780 [Nonomuraea sp. NPDC050404]|uniref:hypothetical protein n=1 Tax=Nonomuraea sp. NPDC050404 TaxID=3155783 RepID=UPI003410ECE9
MSVTFRKAAYMATMTAALAMASLAVGSIPAGAASPPQPAGETSSKPVASGGPVGEADPSLKAAPSEGGKQSGISVKNFLCWTSFDPVNPHGKPMYQYYNNCANHGAWVQPGFYMAGNPTFYPTASCTWVQPSNNSNNSDLKVWYYSSTVASGATYVTKFC